MILDNTLGDGKSKSGALTRFLGGEKRIEYLRLNFTGNPGSFIFYIDRGKRLHFAIRVLGMAAILPGDTDFEKANKQGVKLMGEIMGECDGNSIKFSYVSQNPFCPGEGIGTAWVEDNGEGANAEDDDLFCIYIKSGPFDDYRNCGKKKYGEYQGRVVQGNIQYHPCDGSDGGELIW